MESEGEGEETPAAPSPAAGRLKGSPELSVDADMREMAKTAASSVSSCKPGNGVVSLRDDNLDTYWQSDGGQPHMVNVQFQKKLVVLYVDFKLDESYTPSKISIRAGDGFHNLKEIKTVELSKPVGWCRHCVLWGYLSAMICYDALKINDSDGNTASRDDVYTGSGPQRWRETFINTFMLQIAVLSNHLNGRDTHIRQIKIYGPRPNPVPHQPFHFISREFITYSTVR